MVLKHSIKDDFISKTPKTCLGFLIQLTVINNPAATESGPH